MDLKKEFCHESVEDRESIGKYLLTLSEGFRKGALEFETGEEKAVLEPAGLIQVEIKAKDHHGKVKLSVKFVWKEGRKGEVDRLSPLRRKRD